MKKLRSFLYILMTLIVTCFLFIRGQGTSINKNKPNQILEIQNAINQTNKLLLSSKEEKKQVLKNLDVLQSQIQYRKELQSELKSEIQSTLEKINTLYIQNELNSKESKKWHQEYAQILKNKLIHRLTYNPLLTILQPSGLDEQVSRWYLLEKIENQRYQTLNSLKHWKNKYQLSLAELTNESKKQDSLLKILIDDENKIKTDLSNSQLLVSKINTYEASLLDELTDYKKRKEQLNSWIKESMINLNKLAPNLKTSNKSDFIPIKFPMKSSTIISRFGKNIESNNKNLIIRNNGIDLQSQDPFVTAAMAAEVVQIRKMPNQLYLLITRNQNKYIVYSNLESVLLRNGEFVETGTNIGKAYQNESGQYELHFETWDGKTPKDPLIILAGRTQSKD